MALAWIRSRRIRWLAVLATICIAQQPNASGLAQPWKPADNGQPGVLGHVPSRFLVVHLCQGQSPQSPVPVILPSL
ncbi:MAG: hypothetical protein ABSA26_14170 [Thermoguttaceae bacterium]